MRKEATPPPIALDKKGNTAPPTPAGLWEALQGHCDEQIWVGPQEEGPGKDPGCKHDTQTC